MCSNKPVRKVFKNLPEHQFLRVIAQVDLLDRWKGENLIIKVNGKIL